ncbi:PE family protein PE22 [Mycobacterium tuberculosis]|nr:PE family protein PE22 [Mycobacterium tuberculosis]
MSFVNVDPFGMLAAAATLESLGSHMAVSNAAVASVTTKVPPPAADYVSKKLSLFFSSHGQQYQVQAARARPFIENWSGPWRMARLRMRKSRSPTTKVSNVSPVTHEWLPASTRE